MKKFFCRLPRILSILFIVFISIFAFDVFNQPQWFLALIIHLIPSFILIILTVISWKHPNWGGLVFILLGIFLFRFLSSPAIGVAILVIGTLFVIESHFCFKK